MKILFSDAKSRKERRKDIVYHFKMDPFYFEGDKITPISEVIVEGAIMFDDDVIEMDVNIKAELELNCSRCLDTFIYPVDIDIKERFTNNSQITNEEIVFAQSDIINITEVIENSIISMLPIKRLCKEDCKGLCQKCGVNLNKETCTCNSADIDIRLEGLKALLDNKEV